MSKKSNNTTKFVNDYKVAKTIIERLMRQNKAFKAVGADMVKVLDKKTTASTVRLEKASFIAPKVVEVEVAKHSKKFPKYLIGRKGLKKVFLDKGEYYTTLEICARYGLTLAMLNYRLRKGWDLVRAFGVANHRIDHYVAENLEKMRIH